MIDENVDAEVILEEVPDSEEVPDLEEVPALEDVPVDIAIELAEEIAEENDAEFQELLDAVPIGRSRRSRNIRPSVRLQEYLQS